MAKKYYAVAFGKEGSGVYTNWSQTEKNVKGVSNVKYKSFPGLKAAREFLLEQNVSESEIQLFNHQLPLESKQNKDTEELKSVEKNPAKRGAKSSVEDQMVGLEFNEHKIPAALGEKQDRVYAYVDGSFREGYDVYGYGVVIVAHDKVLKTFSGCGRRPEYVTMRNVAGEVLGAVKAMEYALSVGAKELIIYFDYQGIESWAKGTWKRNNDLTRGYYEFTKEIQTKLKLIFIKVKGHSGDRYNDLADQLAKQGVLNSEGSLE